MTDTTFLGICITIRQTPEGEDLWQAIMANSCWITEDDFLAHCDLSPVLDPDETPEQRLDAFQPETFCSSVVGGRTYYFVASSGFEYIFKTNLKGHTYGNRIP